MSQSLRRGVPGKGGKPQKGCPMIEGGGGGEARQGASSQNTRPERLFIADTHCKLILGSPTTVTVYTLNSWKRCFSRDFALSLSLSALSAPKHVVLPGMLSGPLRLRVQSRSRTRLRIAASIVFLFHACFKGVFDYRMVEPPKWFRTRRLRTPTCVWMRDRAR